MLSCPHSTSLHFAAVAAVAVAHFASSGAGSADFNSNDVVEGGDLAVLLGAWGPC